MENKDKKQKPFKPCKKCRDPKKCMAKGKCALAKGKRGIYMY